MSGAIRRVGARIGAARSVPLELVQSYRRQIRFVIIIHKFSKAFLERHGGMLFTEFADPVRAPARVDTAVAHTAARVDAGAAVWACRSCGA
jgi:hypothetical protein